MRRAAALAAVALLGGCASTPATVTVDGAGVFVVQVASTPEEMARGYQDVTEVPAGAGIVFTWPDAAPRELWMAHTLVSLDVAWIREGRVIATETMTPCAEPIATDCPRYASPGPVDQALEVRAGALAAVDLGAVATTRTPLNLWVWAPFAIVAAIGIAGAAVWRRYSR